MSFLTTLFGDPNAKIVKQIQPIVDKINELEQTVAQLSNELLKGKTIEFKERLQKGENLDNLLPEAFAVVREVSKRLTGMRHFDVQLMGGIFLHKGNIAEMHTGEGKTLTATLPLYLNALTGKGVHLVTVNDYLAKRDAVWMGQIYDFLGLSVGVIQNQLVSYRYNPHKKNIDLSEGSSEDKKRDENGVFKVEYDYLDACPRKDVYKCDIVYGTNNEFGFDYLRDNMVQSLSEVSQRTLHFAIVDEVDSILIDEARTPLIISAPAEEAAEMYYKFADLVSRLQENDDYNIDEKMHASTLTETGIKKIEQWLGIENIYAEGGIVMVHHVEQALKAKALFKRDRDYVVEQGEVIIVDEFTGRKMPGRRYSEGLHQAIEAKERVAIQRESRTMATITFQNYFRMYEKLSGMTGTAVTEAEEFGKIYKLEVVVVPSHRPKNRLDKSDKIYKTQEGKFRAIAKEVKTLQQKGQPVLIGTVSVEKNEFLAMFLEQEGVKYEILNAKNHEREGEIIAQAGKPGAVTLATNMAGRGVDIILGGNPPVLEDGQKVRDLGGLYVLGTERHESRRIDNQLRGRAGRQGDPGETQFYLSTEDDLMRIFAGDRIKSVMQTLGVGDDMPIEQKTITRIIESAQRKVEGFHFDTRKHLLEYDDVLNRHREVIYGNRRTVLQNYEEEKKIISEGKNAQEERDETLRDMIFKMIEEEIEQVVSFHTNTEDISSWNMEEICQTLSTILPLQEEEKTHLASFSLPTKDRLEIVVLRTKLIEYCKTIFEKRYEELLVKKTPHPELLLELEKQMLLRSIDNLWIDHLVAVDYLRTGIGLRGYGQRDPLVEYKKETYRMFNELLQAIQKEVVYSIFKVSIGIQMAPSIMEQQEKATFQGAEKTTITDSPARSDKPQNSEGEEIGRNDFCFCGSGKKYKRCHGA